MESFTSVFLSIKEEQNSVITSENRDHTDMEKNTMSGVSRTTSEVNEDHNHKQSTGKQTTCPVKVQVTDENDMVADLEDEDEIAWDAAKIDAASYVMKKKIEPKKKGIFSLFRRSKSFTENTSRGSDVKDGKTLQSEPRKSLSEFDLVDSCPLMNPPITTRSERKIAVCEKNEGDRDLVYHSLKFYRQAVYIDTCITP